MYCSLQFKFVFVIWYSNNASSYFIFYIICILQIHIYSKKKHHLYIHIQFGYIYIASNYFIHNGAETSSSEHDMV